MKRILLVLIVAITLASPVRAFERPWETDGGIKNNAPDISQPATSVPDMSEADAAAEDVSVSRERADCKAAKARYTSAYRHYENIVTTHSKSDVDAALQQYKDAVAVYNALHKKTGGCYQSEK
jgi:predicted secreted protein